MGDMFASVYDPNGKSADAFDMANMNEATDAKIMTAAERSRLAAAPKVFGTIAALRLNTDPEIVWASVSGYHSATNPRGGGTFFLDASDVSTGDDGGWTIVDAGGRRWKRQCDRHVVYVDDFGARGDDTGDDGPAARMALSKITASGDGEMRFRGGVYRIGGDGTGSVGDQYQNGLLIPGRGTANQTAGVRVTIRGEGHTKLVAITDNTILIRVSDPGACVFGIDLVNTGIQNTVLTNNIGLALCPEDLTSTTIWTSTNYFVAEDLLITGFRIGVYNRPGPTTVDGGSGAFYAQFRGLQLNFNVTSYKAETSINAANNYPTRTLFIGGRVERTMVAFDLHDAAETHEIMGVNTQLVNQTYATYPNYASGDFPVADGSARIFWISPTTRLCKVIGGHNESNHTWGVYAENDTPISALWLDGYHPNGLHAYNGVSTGEIPHALMLGGAKNRFGPLNQAQASELLRFMFGGSGSSPLSEIRVDRNANGVNAPLGDISFYLRARRRYTLDDNGTNGGDHIWYNNASAPAEVMRLTAAGQLSLVGSDGNINFLTNGRTISGTATQGIGMSTTGTAVALSAGTSTVLVSSGVFQAGADNSISLGLASYRWKDIAAANPTIITSDLREKDWRGGLDETELRVAKRLAGLVGIYRWKASIAEKGESARLHAGVTVQAVMAAFEAEGLDPVRYGLICYDEWEDRFEPVTATRKVPLVGPDGRPEIDKKTGIPLVVDEIYETGEQRLTLAAGNRYGLRYDHLWAFVAAGQEARLARMEARLSVLEGI